MTWRKQTGRWVREAHRPTTQALEQDSNQGGASGEGSPCHLVTRSPGHLGSPPPPGAPDFRRIKYLAVLIGQGGKVLFSHLQRESDLTTALGLWGKPVGGDTWIEVWLAFPTHCQLFMGSAPYADMAEVGKTQQRCNGEDFFEPIRAATP